MLPHPLPPPSLPSSIHAPLLSFPLSPPPLPYLAGSCRGSRVPWCVFRKPTCKCNPPLLPSKLRPPPSRSLPPPCQFFFWYDTIWQKMRFCSTHINLTFKAQTVYILQVIKSLGSGANPMSKFIYRLGVGLLELVKTSQNSELATMLACLLKILGPNKS